MNSYYFSFITQQFFSFIQIEFNYCGAIGSCSCTGTKGFALLNSSGTLILTLE
jgi:hypothetical protein